MNLSLSLYSPIRADLRHGQGVEYYADGSKFEGTWKEGKKVHYYCFLFLFLFFPSPLSCSLSLHLCASWLTFPGRKRDLDGPAGAVHAVLGRRHSASHGGAGALPDAAREPSRSRHRRRSRAASVRRPHAFRSVCRRCVAILCASTEDVEYF